uniref:Cuticle protein n=1 Tax=Panagrellus redivivus TaxID=6233 RepID=A0A7E4UQV3_PANRE
MSVQSTIFAVVFAALMALTQAQVYYAGAAAPAVAQYAAWPAVGESAIPYYSAAYAGVPVYASPYAYAVGSGSKGPEESKPVVAKLTNNRAARL